MQTFTIIGILASIFTGISMLPQLLKVLKEKKAKDVSVLMLAILFIGVCCWIYYGMLKNDLIIIISNSFSLLINTILLMLTLKYKKKILYKA